MELLFICNYQFKLRDGVFYTMPAFGDNFWLKYLHVFSTIHIVGVQIKDYLDNGSLVPITDKRISISIIPNNNRPQDFVNDYTIRKQLTQEIRGSKALLIKAACRKGIMAINIAKKWKVPYMVDFTGDLRLTLLNSPSVLKRIYAPLLHRQITKAICDAPYGIYVTEHYLQTVYPIKGKMCGITDSVIDEIDEKVLERRLQYIKSKRDGEIVSIGLIGSYNGNRKGIDIAIKALSRINNHNLKLNLLYNGSEEDRNYWFSFAEKYNLKEDIIFPEPKGSTKEVMEWIDTQDVIILPSRSEGLPRCIVESMSRACPCITSDVCGMPELINNKWIHNPEDYEKLAALLEKMINDKECQEEAAIENFNNSKRFLRSLLEKKRDSFLAEFRDYCIKCSEQKG